MADTKSKTKNIFIYLVEPNSIQTFDFISKSQCKIKVIIMNQKNNFTAILICICMLFSMFCLLLILLCRCSSPQRRPGTDSRTPCCWHQEMKHSLSLLQPSTQTIGLTSSQLLSIKLLPKGPGQGSLKHKAC